MNTNKITPIKPIKKNNINLIQEIIPFEDKNEILKNVFNTYKEVTILDLDCNTTVNDNSLSCSIPVHSRISETDGLRLKKLQELFPQITSERIDNISEKDVYDSIESITVPIWDGEKHTSIKLNVHKNLKDNYIGAFTEIDNIKFPVNLNPGETGAFNYKFTSSGRPSDHCLGCAIDINATDNPYVEGDNPCNSIYVINDDVVKIMAKYGFY